MGTRVKAMTLGPDNVPLVNRSSDLKPERKTTQVMGRPVVDKHKGESLKMIISLSGLSAERKL